MRVCVREREGRDIRCEERTQGARRKKVEVWEREERSNVRRSSSDEVLGLIAVISSEQNFRK